MKKLLLLCAALVSGVCASAEVETLSFRNPADYGYAVPDFGKSTDLKAGQTIEKDAITITVDKIGSTAVRFFNGSKTEKNPDGGPINLRVYKGSTVTVDAAGGTITKIEMKGPSGYENVTKPSVGNYNYASNKASGTWTGESTAVSIACTGTVQIDTMIVTYTPGEGKFVKAPVISGEELFETSTTVTIEAEAGCQIYYSRDGSDPDVEDPDALYSKPFTLTNSATVKAVAVNGDGAKSKVATKEFTKTTVSDIQAAHAATKGAVMTVKNAKVMAVCDAGYVVDDNTDFILIYDFNQAGKFTVGDVLTVTGTIDTYQGVNQFTKTTLVKTDASTPGGYPTATVLDGAGLDALQANFARKYVELTGTVSINNDKYNVLVEGATTGKGSVLSPNADQKGKLVNGAEVKVTGYAMYVSGTVYVNLVPTSIELGSTPEAPVPLELAEYNNGGLEEWTEGYPNQWLSTTSASSKSTVSQSTDAHSGTYSAKLATDPSDKGSNRRLASTEFRLPAGGYIVTLYAKAANAGETGAIRVGYAEVVLDGMGYKTLSGSSYKYTNDNKNIEVPDQWTKIEQFFELKEETIVNFCFMVPKATKDILVDDISVTPGYPAGISDVVRVDKNAVVYDLQGRKLNKVQKGVNIVGNAKVLVK